METEDRVQPGERESKIYHVDPVLLMRHNPAVHILDTRSYQRLDEDFSPELFDPVEIVRVRAFSPEHGQIVKPLLLNGMTRVKYAADNKGKTIEGKRGFSFDSIPVCDVTGDISLNLAVMQPDERVYAEDGLSPLQYLRAEIPLMFSHRHIVGERIAALIMSGWDNAVGSKTAKHFSALQALHFLRDSFRPIISMHLLSLLEDFLSNDEEFLEDLPGREQKRIYQGLIQTATIIQNEGLDVHTLVGIATGVAKSRRNGKKTDPTLNELAAVSIQGPQIRGRRP